MSAHSSQELAESNLDSKGKVSQQSGSLNGMNTAKPFSGKISRGRKFMETFKKSISMSSKKLTSSQEVFLVKTSVLQVKEKESWKGKGRASGNMFIEPLGKFDQSTRSLKTFQRLLFGDSAMSLQTLPKLGMMRNGFVFELRISERCIAEKEFSLLPTVTATDAMKVIQPAKIWKLASGRFRKANKSGIDGSMSLPQVLHFTLPTPSASDTEGGVRSNPKRAMEQKLRDELMRHKKVLLPTPLASSYGKNPRLKNALLPTIGANEYKGSGKNRYKGGADFRGAKMPEGLRTSKDDPIYLSPSFAEVVMGFPKNWTKKW